MAEESFQERTEKATPRRREEARRQGQVARSPEVSSFAVLSFSLLGLLLFGPFAVRTLGEFAAQCFERFHELELTVTSTPHLARQWLGTFARAAAWPALTAAVVGTGVAVLQVGWKPSAASLGIKWERFDPVQGLRRLASMRSLFQLGRDALKLAIIGGVAYLAIDVERHHAPYLMDLQPGQVAGTLGGMAFRVGFKITAALLAIAVLDFAYQKFEFEKNLRMTPRQVQEETRHLEGDPQVKGRIRRVQRETSRRRMLEEVARADVVVTHPAHLAVALRYERDAMAAPTVIARGSDRLAQTIPQAARAHGVPVIENRELARVLYRTVAVGIEIPVALFEATAGVLARALRERGGDGA